MEEKLNWEEISRQFDKEWVELIDYDWPEEEVNPRAGVVRVHAKTREEFDKLSSVNPPQDAAVVFVGTPAASEYRVRASSQVRIVPTNA